MPFLGQMQVKALRLRPRPQWHLRDCVALCAGVFAAAYLRGEAQSTRRVAQS